MNAPELVRNHTNEGIYCALVVRGGRKWLRVVILDARAQGAAYREARKRGADGTSANHCLHRTTAVIGPRILFFGLRFPPRGP